MTDHKFTDAEIVKALECCNTPGSCDKCPYYGINEVEYDDLCVQTLINDILPLINRQKAEIEAKEEEYADLLGQRNAVEMMLDRANYNCDKADEEIEYLKSENARLITSNSQLEARVCEDRTEIEKLNTVHADMTESLRLAAEANKDMQAEIERLTAERDNEHRCYLHICEDLKQAVNRNITAKAEAIKEFAWRLKNRLTPYPEAPFCEMVGSLDIDALVKEMTEKEV